jgi:urea transporter
MKPLDGVEVGIYSLCTIVGSVGVGVQWGNGWGCLMFCILGIVLVFLPKEGQ